MAPSLAFVAGDSCARAARGGGRCTRSWSLRHPACQCRFVSRGLLHADSGREWVGGGGGGGGGGRRGDSL